MWKLRSGNQSSSPPARQRLLARAHQPRDVQLGRYLDARWLLGGLFLCSLVAYLAMIPVPRADGQLIGSDGVGYYVYVRSWVIDHDLDFTNEYTYYRHAFADLGKTPTSRPANIYSVGPALLWLPFFLIGHLIALAGQTMGGEVKADGFGYLYQAAISLGSIVYGWLGLTLCYHSHRRVCGRTAALAGVATFWLASNAIYYMLFEPSMAHMVSLFSGALLLSAWSKWMRRADPPSIAEAALVGVAGGLVMLVRLQDAILLLLPYGYMLVRSIAAWKTHGRGEALPWIGKALAAGSVTLLFFVPQLVVWQRLYGTWTTIPYAHTHDPAFYWFQPQLYGVLLSSYHGLFSWHPIYFLAVIGLALLARREPALVLGSLLVVCWTFTSWPPGGHGGRAMPLAGVCSSMRRGSGRSGWPNYARECCSGNGYVACCSPPPRCW